MTEDEILEEVCYHCVARSIGANRCRGKECELIKTLRPIVERSKKRKIRIKEDRKKKVVFSVDVYCSACGHELDRYNILHEIDWCPKCGQHLDWSDDD